ncbi:LysR substrate-binding domain-containing protein [Ornithinimicrobium sp. F0845]|uniref:LysR substrate-binding domain-containing protein n=1 Tax=Ornithinimicrobium sp. F0845 TaxID=2926412 RepID=UPI001FF2E64E|nr:LysR substrate-binding domain-containing protein [Ornithinimicrobium sp. F0845]MCK0112503.1 LysR substrate-binding domain-containing protein [Ornithinimicrobium sp. F0845]
MDTRDLRWFQQVADGITVTELSEVEGTTQPGVSRALARLDREIGTPLLHRVGRTLRMTHAGAAFKRHVDALLHELDDGLAAVEQLVDPEAGTVTLAFHASLGSWLVPDLLSSFGREHPGVRFSLHAQPGLVATAAGPSTGVDMELTTSRPHGPAVRWAHLVEQPLCLAVPADHRLASGRVADRAVTGGGAAVDLTDVSGEPMVLLRPGWALRETTEELADRAGFTPNVAFECEDLATARAFVASGLGVSVLPAPSPGEQSSAQVRYLPLRDRRAVREIGLAWSAEHRMLPSAALFREHVVEAAGRLQSLGTQVDYVL